MKGKERKGEREDEEKASNEKGEESKPAKPKRKNNDRCLHINDVLLNTGC
jgi:hypothetical protein